MASRKVKHARAMEKRAKWEDEVKQRGLAFLKAEQTQRAEEHKKAEEARKERAIAKSKRLAKQHKQAKTGIKTYKPAPTNLPKPKNDTGDISDVVPQEQEAS